MMMVRNGTGGLTGTGGFGTRPYVQSDVHTGNQPKDMDVLNRRMLCKNSRPGFLLGVENKF